MDGVFECGSVKCTARNYRRQRGRPTHTVYASATSSACSLFEDLDPWTVLGLVNIAFIHSSSHFRPRLLYRASRSRCSSLLLFGFYTLPAAWTHSSTSPLDSRFNHLASLIAGQRRSLVLKYDGHAETSARRSWEARRSLTSVPSDRVILGAS